jgi:hypothetical protein
MNEGIKTLHSQRMEKLDCMKKQRDYEDKLNFKLNSQPTRDTGDYRGRVDEAEINLLRENINRERQALCAIEDAVNTTCMRQKRT